jgi:hypothetical protein
MSSNATANRYEALLANVKSRGLSYSRCAEQLAAETPRPLFLPGFDIGGFPNHLNRSSLIAPIARGQRKFHRQATMVTRRDCVLEYTGEQLDEADADLLMALIASAKKFPVGAAVPLNRAELLRRMERGTGKQQYEWLHRRLKAMTEATLFLEAMKPDRSIRYSIGKTVSFRIVAEFIYDDEIEVYTYRLDPRWVQMFGNEEYSLIDWEKRMQIGRGQDMAKTLQRLVATSSEPVQRYALVWLKAKMEYSGRMRDFKDALARAVRELERLEIVCAGRVEVSTRGKLQLVLRNPAL